MKIIAFGLTAAALVALAGVLSPAFGDDQATLKQGDPTQFRVWVGGCGWGGEVDESTADELETILEQFPDTQVVRGAVVLICQGDVSAWDIATTNNDFCEDLQAILDADHYPASVSCDKLDDTPSWGALDPNG